MPILVSIVVASVTLHGGDVMAQSSAGTDLHTDDAFWTIVGRSAAAGRYNGREAFLRDVIRPFNARMRVPLKPTVRRIHADGDTVIVMFDAEGTARDGRPYANTYAWFLQAEPFG